MKVTQMADTLNNVFEEIIGTFEPDESGAVPLYKEDLSNFIDMGRKIEASTEWGSNFDHYVAKLIDRIGKSKIIDKELTTDGIDIETDRYEYGALLQKIRIGDLDFVDNEAWKLVKGQNYDYTTFNPVDMEAQYFSDKTTFGVEWSWIPKVLKGSITDLSAMIKLFSAIENRVGKKVKMMTTAMKKRLVNNQIACNIKNSRYINLLEEYKKATNNTTLTAATALTDKEFLKHTVVVLKKFKKFITEPTKLYNNEGELNWTPSADLRMVALIDFDAALDAYLASDTYHNEFVSFSGYTSITAWQGRDSGNDDDFEVRSSINVISTLAESEDDATLMGGIMFHMFDKEGLSVYNEEPEMATAPYNPKGKFINYFYSYDCNYYYDPYENSITFVLSDYSPVASEPADWGTGTYYIVNENGAFTSATISASTPFVKGKYYKKIA